MILVLNLMGEFIAIAFGLLMAQYQSRPAFAVTGFVAIVFFLILMSVLLLVAFPPELCVTDMQWKASFRHRLYLKIMWPIWRI